MNSSTLLKIATAPICWRLPYSVLTATCSPIALHPLSSSKVRHYHFMPKKAWFVALVVGLFFILVSFQGACAQRIIKQNLLTSHDLPSAFGTQDEKTVAAKIFQDGLNAMQHTAKGMSTITVEKVDQKTTIDNQKFPNPHFVISAAYKVPENGQIFDGSVYLNPTPTGSPAKWLYAFVAESKTPELPLPVLSLLSSSIASGFVMLRRRKRTGGVEWGPDLA